MSCLYRVVFPRFLCALLAFSPISAQATFVAVDTNDLTIELPPLLFCPGDCDGSGGVSIDEIIRGVNLALGNLPLAECTAMDVGADGKVTVDELLRAVNSALHGCPTPIPTASATATSTPTPTATTTPTATSFSTNTATQTPTATPTPSATATATATPSVTITVTPTSTVTAPPTATATTTASPTATQTLTYTRTTTPTSSVPPTPTASETSTQTETPTALPESLRIHVGSATGHPGERVSVTVTLHTGGERIVATENRILLDVRAPIAAQGTRPDCTVNPAINKNAATFVFLPPDCASGGSCELIKSIVISFDSSEPIPDGSVLYTCAADIAADTKPGDLVPLVCTQPVGSGPRGEFFAPACINGEITVEALVK